MDENRVQKEIDDLWNAVNALRENGTGLSKNNLVKIDNLAQSINMLDKREEKHNTELKASIAAVSAKTESIMSNCMTRMEASEQMYHKLDKATVIEGNQLAETFRKQIREENKRTLIILCSFISALVGVAGLILKFA